MSSLSVTMPKKRPYAFVWDIITLLATRLPLDRPVFLHIVSSKRTHGTTRRERDGYHIELSRGSQPVMIETALHEWSHARCWNRGKDHGNRWGVEYSRAYRIVMGED
jgi:hypothetical protein